MSTDLDLYRGLEQDLRRLMVQNEYETQEEADILARMDVIWDRLTPQDIRWLEARGEVV
mgnify:FL=1